MARGNLVWYNGKIIPAEQAKISLFTHALHYGVGAFEGIRAYKQKTGGGAVFRLKEHMIRLEDSVKILGFDMPFTVDQMVKGTLETCKANGFDECYVRPIAFVADGPLGVYPGENPPIDVAILNWEWGSYLGDKGINDGVKLKTSSFIRPHVNSVMTKGKITGQYVTGVISKREAIQQGFDEALMVDPDGFLTEGTGENLFIIRDGVVKTTPLTSILNGLTRQSIMKMLESFGLKVVEQRFSRDEMWCADEIFLTGTAAEITPVREIDHRLIGRDDKKGKPGPVTLRVKTEYAQLVRGEKSYEFSRDWLTKI